MGSKRGGWIFLAAAAVAVCFAVALAASGFIDPAAGPEGAGGGRMLLAGMVVLGAAAVGAVGLALRKRGLERHRGGPPAP